MKNFENIALLIARILMPIYLSAQGMEKMKPMEVRNSICNQWVFREPYYL